MAVTEHFAVTLGSSASLVLTFQADPSSSSGAVVNAIEVPQGLLSCPKKSLPGNLLGESCP